MANKRDVRLSVEVETAGEEGIRRLAADVRSLAKEGADAAPAYEALAAELDALGNQAKTLTGLKALAEAVDTLGAQQTEAAAAASALKAKLDEASQAVETARARQGAANAERAAATQALRDQQLALQRLNAEYTGEDKTVASFVTQQRALKVGIVDAKQALDEKKAALQAAKDATEAAQAVERPLAEQYERAATAARKQAEALQARNAELRSAQAAASAAGVATTDLAAAEQVLVAQVQQNLAAARLQRDLTDAQREADELAALEVKALAEARRQGAASAAAELAALKDSEEFTRRYAAEQERAAKAVTDLTDDLDRQAAALQGRLVRALADSAAAYEKDERAAREDARAAEALTAARREQAEADRLAIITLSSLAAARKRGQQDLEAELASLREAAEFSQRYEQNLREQAAAKARAADEALEYVLALEREEQAARAATQRVAELNAQAERTKAGERYVREVAAAFDAVEEQARQATAATQQLQTAFDKIRADGDVVSKAFGQAGVRSIEAIRQEIFAVNSAMSTLRTRYAEGAISAEDLARATSSAAVRVNTLTREIQTIPSLPGQFEQMNTAITGAINKFGALTAAIGTVGVALRPIIEATIALEQMRRVLTTVTGSAESAGRQIEFLRAVAQQSGQSFTEIGQSYAKFAASALQSGLTLNQTQEVFQSVALAAGNLGLSSDQAKRALEALSQIASKGTVSMEELRQQLGDALPGVLPLLAKELGLTQAELNKVVESGQLLASEAIPAIGRSLRSLGPASGEVKGITAEFNRFKNVMLEAGTAITEGPLGRSVGFLLTSLAGVLRDVAFVAVSASEGISLVAKTAGASVAFLANGAKGFDEYKRTISEFALEAGANIEKFKTTAYSAGAASDTAAKSVASLGGSFARLSLDQQKAVDAADLSARTLEVLAQASQKAGQGAAALAQAAGDQAGALEKTAQAAEGYATALERQADADEQAAEARRAFKQALIDEATARGLGSDAIKAQVEALNKEIQTKDAAAIKSREAANEATASARAARDAAAAFADNAGRYEEYREAVVGAERALDGVRRAMARGKATTEDVTKAEIALYEAKRRLNDAIDDQLERSERLIEGLKAEADYTKALLELDIAKLKVKQDEALARGNETQARQLGLQVAELELAVTQTNTQAKRAEANETIRSLALRREEMRAAGTLTPAIEAELNVRIRRAQTQVVEADTSETATAAQEKHLVAVRNGTASLEKSTASTAANSSTVATNTTLTGGNTAARTANAQATERQLTAQERYNKLLLEDPSRLVSGGPLGGINGQAGASPITGVRQPGGSSNQLAADGGSNFSVLGPSGSSTGVLGGAQLRPPDDSGQWEFVPDQTWGTGLSQNEILQAMQQGRPVPRGNVAGIGYWRRKSGAPAPAATAPGGSIGSVNSRLPTPAPAPQPTSGPSSTRVTIDLTVGAKSFQTNVASAADADSLLAALTEMKKSIG